ncbi:hypothetical protein PsorP6_015555 [Peronosclerospora sorghi]|uniref:Uncharacterized protein n=1 Tax=Peronosclerospora sorghi TaxID=230839 RepID=A0ACC0WN92_9STRA|nr:hypothetical protein PsorP6_015555 [Peronosclerospora sorghi]
MAPAPTRLSSLTGCFRSILEADTVLNKILFQLNFEGTVLEPIEKSISKFQSDNVLVSDVYQAFISLTKERLDVADISSEQKYYLVM